MNPLALWIPGTLLVVVALVSLALGMIDFEIGLALAVAGVVMETAGALLWVRQRRAVPKA